MFENPRRGTLARNFAKNVQKLLDLKSSSEQIFSEYCRWVPLSTCFKIQLERSECRIVSKEWLFREPIPTKRVTTGFKQCLRAGYNYISCLELVNLTFPTIFYPRIQRRYKTLRTGSTEG